MPRPRRARPYSDPGFRRQRAGSGFRFIDDRGRGPDRRQRARIESLVIPPAWTDVWISADARAHIQAVGTDGAGRRQYVYHPDWIERRSRAKFVRALALAEVLPVLRGQVTRGLRREGLDRERVLAAALRLLDVGALRIGSEEYFVAHGSRGLTTLQRRDAQVEGTTVTLSFTAKGGKPTVVEVEDADLAVVLAELAKGRARAPLFSYFSGRRRIPLHARDVNLHLRTLTGGAFTAKDFRTLRGTVVAAEALAQIGPAGSERERRQAERIAVQAAADALGDTVAVARGSYIDPRVFTRYRDGRLLDLDGSSEAALRRLLE